VSVRTRDYNQRGIEAKLSRATSATPEVLPVVREMFDRLFEADAEYRATIIVLGKLEDDRDAQRELFADNIRIEKMEAVSRAIDDVAGQFGKHRIGLGPSLYLDRHPATARDQAPLRRAKLLPGETARQRLNIPRLFVRV
jgi:hypothetical protein